MSWNPHELPPANATGCAAEYLKHPDSFVKDYKLAIDFAKAHGINGIIIWGFLRDSHGGIDYSKEVAAYGKKNEVNILPGVGTSGYGGYYFDGDHKYSTTKWLEKHPELCAFNKDGKLLHGVLCPSKEDNMKWLLDGLHWLYETFDIGGVNFEIGDFFVCYCEDCVKNRANIGGNDPDYYTDMAISQAPLIEEAYKIAPDSWITYATYTGFGGKFGKSPQFLKLIPDYAICQWTLTNQIWEEGETAPAKHNIGLLHYGSVFAGNAVQYFVGRIKKACKMGEKAGFEGMVMYGEQSPDRGRMLINYLAFEAFCNQPTLNFDGFAQECLRELDKDISVEKILSEEYKQVLGEP